MAQKRFLLDGQIPIIVSKRASSRHIKLSIGSDGTVSATLPGQTNAAQVGVLQLATFANPGGLNSIGNNLMLPTDASGEPIVGNERVSDGILIWHSEHAGGLPRISA